MDVSTDALREVRDQANRDAGDKRARLTYTHLMIKACALALEKFPQVNATFRAEENDIAMFDAINIGLAVDVQDELVAPTVKDCQGKSVWQLAEEANSLIQRARMRKLQPADYADGTFTISNLGMFGVDRFYAIITPPQSSILAVSAIAERPIVRERPDRDRHADDARSVRRPPRARRRARRPVPGRDQAPARGAARAGARWTRLRQLARSRSERLGRVPYADALALQEDLRARLARGERARDDPPARAPRRDHLRPRREGRQHAPGPTPICDGSATTSSA